MASVTREEIQTNKACFAGGHTHKNILILFFVTRNSQPL